MGKMNGNSITGIVTMNAVRAVDSDLVKILRGVAVVVAAVLMILPAYINYEGWKFGLNPVVSMAISLQGFAIGIVVFILAVGKERLAPKAQPQ